MKKTEYRAFFKSESGDRYDFIFKSKERPTTDEEWKKLFKKYIDNDDTNTDKGPGLAGTYLHLVELEET